MRARQRRSLATAAAAAAAACAVSLLAGCGSGAANGSAPAANLSVPRIPLATSMSTAGGSWAIVRTGGQSVGGKFWQLLVRPAGSSRWQLATPPGVADNGGLAVAGTGNGALTAGFVPNQLLRFTPLAFTTDDGTHWTQGLLPAGLAATPSALAVLPGDRLLAVTASGAEISGPAGRAWRSLVTLRALAASSAGRACGLTRLTAAAAGPAGGPLLGGDCTRPGAVGIFELAADGWRLVEPLSGGPAARRPLGTLQLAATAAGTAVLLAAGSGRAEDVIGGWLPAGAQALATGVPLPTRGSPLTSTSFSAPIGWGLVIGGRAQLAAVPVSAPGQVQARSGAGPVALPAPDATLVLGPGQAGALTALVPGLDTVTVWQRSTAGQWQRTQVIGLPSVPG